jgi:hypothetical protein
MDPQTNTAPQQAAQPALTPEDEEALICGVAGDEVRLGANVHVVARNHHIVSAASIERLMEISACGPAAAMARLGWHLGEVEQKTGVPYERLEPIAILGHVVSDIRAGMDLPLISDRTGIPIRKLEQLQSRLHPM